MEKCWYGAALVVALVGCGGEGIGGGSDVSCSIAAGADALRTQLQQEAVSQLRNERKPDGSPLFSSGTIEAAVESIAVSLSNHRTTRDADKSKRVDCQAQLTFSIPSDRLNQTTQGLESMVPGALDGLADRAGYRHEANTLSSEIRYALQPTDDGKAIYAEMEQGEHHATVLQQLAAGWLISPLLGPRGQLGSNTAAETISANQAATLQAQPPSDSSAMVPAPVSGNSIAAMPAEVEIVEGKFSPGPSFNCSKASTAVERAICASPLLSELDYELAETYKNIRGSDIGSGAREALKVSQRQWLRDRNRCQDSLCLRDQYLARIDSVCSTPVITGLHPNCIDTDAYR